MEPYTNDSPLIVILGPTASGKTALSIELARRFNGEIIAADSRTVYKGMDIGTAKPTQAEMAGIRHHLIDVTTPDKPYNVHRFQQAAVAAIDEIAARGKVPFLVGGTGLYIDAVIYNFSFAGGSTDQATRAALSELSIQELQMMIIDRGLALPADPHNPRRLIRVIERNGVEPQRQPLRARTVLLGLDIAREQLQAKIERRVDSMVAAGLANEVKLMSSLYGWDVPAMQAPAYKSFRSYIEGMATLEEAKQLFVRLDMQYAKRQKTWFKRNESIHWISKTEEAVGILTTILNK